MYYRCPKHDVVFEVVSDFHVPTECHPECPFYGTDTAPGESDSTSESASSGGDVEAEQQESHRKRKRW